MKKLHKSVLVNEVLEYLNVKEGGLYLDATLGGGGHTRAILKAAKCNVIAFDLDKTIINKVGPKFDEDFGDRIKIMWGNFAAIYSLLKKAKVKKVDGILADFGTSQYQIQERPGFSFLIDSPLDMRMSSAHTYWKASDVVNRFEPNKLTEIFSYFGGERYAKSIANAIVKRRETRKIETTLDLVSVIESAVPTRVKLISKIHPATKVFQALRIFVNQELESIENFLKSSLQFLNPSGRIVCISFHSLEDRIVKNFFEERRTELKILTRKPVVASEKELKTNLSARSAKLRAAEKF